MTGPNVGGLPSAIHSHFHGEFVLLWQPNNLMLLHWEKKILNAPCGLTCRISQHLRSFFLIFPLKLDKSGHMAHIDNQTNVPSNKINGT